MDALLQALTWLVYAVTIYIALPVALLLVALAVVIVAAPIVGLIAWLRTR